MSSSLAQLPSLWSIKHHHESLNLKPQLPSPWSLEMGPLGEDGQFCRKSWTLASQVGVGSHKEVLSQSMFPCFILLYKNSGQIAPVMQQKPYGNHLFLYPSHRWSACDKMSTQNWDVIWFLLCLFQANKSK